MKAYEHIPRYTYSDYAQWEGKWELIDGYPYAMSPSPTRRHQIVYTRLASVFQNELERKPDCKDCQVFQDLDWIISDDTTLRPDIMIVCGEFKDDFLRFPPVLVVEILSKATSLKDRHVKYQLYQGQGVRYYILINPETKSCEIFELVNGEYTAQNSISSFSIHSNCQLILDIPAFIEQLPLY